MGGMGKTTLAQLIYNDDGVKRHFDERIWVCVSEDFDLTRVAKAVLQSLDSVDHVMPQNLDSLPLHNLLKKISESVGGKRIFLVLDDVWNDKSERWKPLKQALKAAAPESRILVTTRKDTVADAMKSFVYHIPDLSVDACCRILLEEAFVGRDGEEFKNLKDVGREIAAKCKGLPLTAKTLGGMLRFKKTREEWESVLNSEVWKWDSVHKESFPALLLSFYELPSAIRRCFLYCSVFPKDHLIKRDELIHEWMAQGYLSCNEKKMEMEDTGVDYFECLVARSFFQDFERLEDGSISACKMHEVLVDFARYLMRDEFVFREVQSGKTDSPKAEIPLEKTRHLLVVRDSSMMELGRTTTPSLLFVGENKLRSLTIFEHKDGRSDDLFHFCFQQKRLRSLKLLGGAGNRFVQIPKEVGKLMHLRLLNLSESGFQTLPDIVCELWNLQTLYLRRCRFLKTLPKKISNLTNLVNLDTTDSHSITYYPKGIQRLTSLRDLRGIVVFCEGNDDNKFSLGDLEHFCHLRFLRLKINGTKINADEAGRAMLQSKMHLKILELELPTPYKFSMLPKATIDALKPPSSANVRLAGETALFWGAYLNATFTENADTEAKLPAVLGEKKAEWEKSEPEDEELKPSDEEKKKKAAVVRVTVHLTFPTQGRG